MKHYVALETQSYMDMHPEWSLYYTELPTEEFVATMKEAIKCASVNVLNYKDVGIDEMYNHIMQIIDHEVSYPQPDTDEYLENVINTFDEVFDNHQKTNDLWDYIKFSGKAKEDADNYLASQGLI
jgi:hypothetical protein